MAFMNASLGLFKGLVDAGGRQFFVCIAAGFVTTLLLILDYIHEDTWQLVTLAIVGGYITGNQVQNYVAAKSDSASLDDASHPGPTGRS